MVQAMGISRCCVWRLMPHNFKLTVLLNNQYRLQHPIVCVLTSVYPYCSLAIVLLKKANGCSVFLHNRRNRIIPNQEQGPRASRGHVGPGKQFHSLPPLKHCCLHHTQPHSSHIGTTSSSSLPVLAQHQYVRVAPVYMCWWPQRTLQWHTFYDTAVALMVEDQGFCHFKCPIGLGQKFPIHFNGI